jgi:hypothetical protein
MRRARQGASGSSKDELENELGRYRLREEDDREHFLENPLHILFSFYLAPFLFYNFMCFI